MNQNTKSTKLNLGCGTKPLEGYINHDIQKYNSEVDITFDLEKPLYPFKDNELDEIYSHHVFEHVRNFIPMVKECYRILKPNGKLIISVPYVRNTGAIANPLHVNYFDEHSFSAFVEVGNAWQIGLDKALFKLNKIHMKFGTFWPIQWFLWKSGIFWCGGEIEYELIKLPSTI